MSDQIQPRTQQNRLDKRRKFRIVSVLFSDPIKAIILFFQGKILNYSVEDGVIISNQSLVLQKVSRAETGLYRCSAFNKEGHGKSKPVNLAIKCKSTFLNELYFI